MNEHVAQKMAADLIGKTVGGWLIRESVNHGKSAVVFRAERGTQVAALKVFDPEIVEHFGRTVQLERIRRETTLVGKKHPNLVEIYDGGEENGLLFVAMEFFPGGNLEELLKDVPASQVRSLIRQVAAGAQFLEESAYAHRDIKPANIGLSSDMTTAKLLDFGVVRPLNLSNVTDEGDQQYFVGTLQYSPPEMLFREEEHSLEGWRAITFYQLGAVLHDLLMRRPLFADFINPYARLVRAVEREMPRIDSDTADADLRLLAQNCLAKAPSQRLDTVKWDDFRQPMVADPLDGARRKIAQRRVASTQTRADADSSEDRLAAQCFNLRTAIFSATVSAIRAEGLPRYSQQEIRQPNPYLLRVFFEPSPKAGLGSHFAFFCQGTVLDAIAEFHELQIWGCIADKRELVPAEPDPTAPHFLIRGTLIEQDIRSHVHQRLLLAYAEGLEKAADGVSWLNVGEGI